MSNKKLAILGIVAVVMVVWAVVQSQLSNRVQTKAATSSYLVSGVNVDEIGSIVVKSGDNTATFRRKGNGFVVASKDNYPAQTSKINDLITNSLEIKVSRLVTDNPANHEDLGVTEENATTIVKFLKPDSNDLVGIIVGKTKENGQGTYVRLTSDNKVYETPQAPWIDSSAINYVKKQLVALVRKDIQFVTVNSPNGEYTIKPTTDSEDVQLVNVPAGKKLKQSDAKSVFTALSSLDFTDVMRNPGDLNFDRHYICRLFNSTQFTFNIATKDSKTYVTCSAEFTEGKPSPDLEADQLKEKVTLYNKANDFNVRNVGWVYEIPSYKATYLTKELSDLVEDQEETASPATTSDPNAVLNNIMQTEAPAGS